MTRSQIIRTSLATAGLALAACSATNTTDLLLPTRFDLGVAITQSAFGDINRYGGVLTTLGIPASDAILVFDPAKCTLNSDNSFSCLAVSPNGLSYSLRYFFYDANGVALSSADPFRAVSLRTILVVTGTVIGVSASSTFTTIDHRVDMTLDGLFSATRTLNGTSVNRDIVTTSGATFSRTTIDVTSTAANLVFPTGASNYPVSGAITSIATTSSTVGSLPQVTTLANAVLSFNGTSTASLIATVSGRIIACQVDLTGARVARCT